MVRAAGQHAMLGLADALNAVDEHQAPGGRPNRRTSSNIPAKSASSRSLPAKCKGGCRAVGCSGGTSSGRRMMVAQVFGRRIIHLPLAALLSNIPTPVCLLPTNNASPTQASGQARRIALVRVFRHHSALGLAHRLPR